MSITLTQIHNQDLDSELSFPLYLMFCKSPPTQQFESHPCLKFILIQDTFASAKEKELYPLANDLCPHPTLQ